MDKGGCWRFALLGREDFFAMTYDFMIITVFTRIM